jgi:hypothetical protein
MTKFKKRIPNQKWNRAQTLNRITLIETDIANMNRDLEKFTTKFRMLKEDKRVLISRLTNKWRYLRQLKMQLKDTPE